MRSYISAFRLPRELRRIVLCADLLLSQHITQRVHVTPPPLLPPPPDPSTTPNCTRGRRAILKPVDFCRRTLTCGGSSGGSHASGFGACSGEATARSSGVTRASGFSMTRTLLARHVYRCCRTHDTTLGSALNQLGYCIKSSLADSTSREGT